MQTKPILLFSGGVDSFVAYHFLGRPQTLFFHSQSRYADKEMEVIKRLIPDTIIDYSLNLKDREYGEKAYIPFRNLLFFLQAVKYSDHVVVAGVADDRVSDKSEKAFQEFSRLASKLEGRPIKITSPFWKLTKSEVVHWYLMHIGNVPGLLQTTSCYDPIEHYCGKCPSCFRKWVALWVNVIHLDFLNDKLMEEYYQAARSGKYVLKRNESIIEAVNGYRSRH